MNDWENQKKTDAEIKNHADMVKASFPKKTESGLDKVNIKKMVKEHWDWGLGDFVEEVADEMFEQWCSQAVQEALQAQRAEIVGECRKIVGKYMPTKKEYIDATDVILMQIIDELELLAREEVK
jgi:hypothetical protein